MRAGGDHVATIKRLLQKEDAGFTPHEYASTVGESVRDAIRESGLACERFVFDEGHSKLRLLVSLDRTYAIRPGGDPARLGEAVFRHGRGNEDVFRAIRGAFRAAPKLESVVLADKLGNTIEVLAAHVGAGDSGSVLGESLDLGPLYAKGRIAG